VLDLLAEAYPEAECALKHSSTFELLVAVILSAQTTDKSVNMVTPELFQKYPNAEALSKANEEDLEQILRRIGMYKTKARNIKLMANMLQSEYGGKVPETFDELIKLPGAGRKTANVVLAVGFGQQRIAVDTHVFRVANRIGLCTESDVLKTEMALMKKLPDNRWTEAHHSLIFHGRNCCMAKKPSCGFCVISAYCVYNTERR
jgi:endonuclease-3